MLTFRSASQGVEWGGVWGRVDLNWQWRISSTTLCVHYSTQHIVLKLFMYISFPPNYEFLQCRFYIFLNHRCLARAKPLKVAKIVVPFATFKWNIQLHYYSLFLSVENHFFLELSYPRAWRFYFHLPKLPFLISQPNRSGPWNRHAFQELCPIRTSPGINHEENSDLSIQRCALFKDGQRPWNPVA